MMQPIAMTPAEITSLLLVAQTAITLLIALRAFLRYYQTRADLPFILAVAMGTIIVVSVVGIIDERFFAGSLRTKWFRYTAQIVSYSFLYLCSLPRAQQASEFFLHKVKRWQLFYVANLLVMLLLIPWLSQFSSLTLEASLSFLRSVVCFVICLNYIALFMKKETLFSLLQAGAFLLISFGIATTTPWYFEQSQVLYLFTGDAMRVAGFVMLFFANLLWI